MANYKRSQLPSRDYAYSSNPVGSGSPIGATAGSTRPESLTGNNPRTQNPKLNRQPWSSAYAQPRTESKMTTVKGRHRARKARKGGKQ